MNAPRLVQCLVWMTFLSVLLIGGGYVSYIANWQFGILIFATAIFSLLVLCDALFNDGHDHQHEHHDHDHGSAFDRWLQTGVHAFPLFFIIAIGVTSLGSQQIKMFHQPAPQSVMRAAAQMPETRIATTTSTPAPIPANASTSTATVAADAATAAPITTEISTSTPPPATFTDGPTSPEPATTPAQTITDPVVAHSPVVPLPLMELYYPKKHPGVIRIETIGRLMIPTAKELENVPPDVDRNDLTLMLYRYVMTCCAADAQPVFVILKNRAVGELKTDTWVKVSGSWIHPPGLGDMAKIEVETLDIIPEPKEPYLQAPQ
jgi:uncharacterized membrane protein YcgQ (UPF0703/DUF1980 family)